MKKAVRLKVSKKGAESTGSVLKRFSYLVRQSGIINHVRNIQYRQRPISRNMRNKKAVQRLKRRAIIEKLIKEGKLKERTKKVIATSVSGKS